MALELNKKKYLVLCLMLILLNHHINGAIGADRSTVVDPSKAELPPGPQGSKAEPPGPQGSKAELPPGPQGSKAEPPSKVSIYHVGFNAAGPVLPSPYGGSGSSTAMSPGKPIDLTPDGGVSQLTNSLIEALTKKEVAAAASGPHELIKIPGAKPGPPQVPCYFVFGDSLVDAGNNNILQTLARADYDPYGMDFKAKLGPTGRFSNGKTAVDVITELLGFDHYIPPSQLTSGKDMLQGLNFASAAAGIREETAQHLGDRITMKEQVDNFRAKKDEMARLLGGDKNTTDYLGKCLFSVGLGSNDYLNNYFIPNIYPTSKLLTPEQFADDLIRQYTVHVLELYVMGARKFVLNGVSQVGCSPNSLAQFSPDKTCVKRINDANKMFNTRLKALVDTLNKGRPDAKFTYINSYGFFQELKDMAATFGFNDTTDGCCGIGKNNGLITCLPGISTCPNRNEYLFWDAYHPTEATNIIGAKRSFKKKLPTDAYPYDISTLITLK